MKPKPETAPQSLPQRQEQNSIKEGPRWEKQVKICQELSDMYELELKRIYEIKANKTQSSMKQVINKKKQQENMRRTGGGFTQNNFFSQNK